jgi:hypothetical protein
MKLPGSVAERAENRRFRKAWEQVRQENRQTVELVRLRAERGWTQARVAEHGIELLK